MGKGRVQGWTAPRPPMGVVRRGPPNHSRDWRFLRGLQTGGLGTQVAWLLLKPVVSDRVFLETGRQRPPSHGPLRTLGSGVCVSRQQTGETLRRASDRRRRLGSQFLPLFRP